MHILLQIAFLLFIYYCVRVLLITFVFPPSATNTDLAKRIGPAVIVLGSGGHTAEMLQWLKETLINHKPSKSTSVSLQSRELVFIVSATDNHSAVAAKNFCVKNKLVKNENEVNIKIIPRAREVGQSYFSSIFTTLKAIFASLMLMHEISAATIITNGPGVAIPIVVADILVAALASTFPFSIILPILKLSAAKKQQQQEKKAILNFKTARAALVYIESFACVDHVSLSGKILIRRIAQVFIVQWPQLYKSLVGKFGKDLVKYSGPFDLKDNEEEVKKESSCSSIEDDDSFLTSCNSLVGTNSFKPLNIPASKSKSNLCLVTVGSTKFEDLINVVNCEEFEQLLLRLGIDELLIQQGACNIIENCEMDNSKNKKWDPQSRKCLKKKTVVNYKHNLGLDIKENAALVISHAGAGTILEALNANVPTVVVPNTKLMANHQLELAVGLAQRGHLLCATPNQILNLLRRLDVDWTKFKPMPPTNGIGFVKCTEGFFHENEHGYPSGSTTVEDKKKK